MLVLERLLLVLEEELPRLFRPSLMQRPFMKTNQLLLTLEWWMMEVVSKRSTGWRCLILFPSLRTCMVCSSLETAMLSSMHTMMARLTDTSFTTGWEMTVARMRLGLLPWGRYLIFCWRGFYCVKSGLLSWMKDLEDSQFKSELLRVESLLTSWLSLEGKWKYFKVAKDPHLTKKEIRGKGAVLKQNNL